MKKTILEWGLVYLLPYAVITSILLFQGKGLGGDTLDSIGAFLSTILIPIIATPLLALMGYFIGFSASPESASFYTIEFKLALVACFAASISFFIIGIKKREKLWGKIINAAGFYLFCAGGLISIAPST